MSVAEAARELPIASDVEVAVVGGGIAGCAAALAARRSGAQVALIEKSCSLGGLATSGLVNTYLPLCDGKGRQVIFGLGEELLKLANRDGYDPLPDCWKHDGEIQARQHQRYRIDFNPVAFLLALEELVVSEGVELWYDTVVCDVQIKAGQLQTLILENKSGRQAVSAKTVIDATGDADICAQAGEATVSQRTNVACGWYFATHGGELKRHITSGAYASDGGAPRNGERGYAGDDAREVTAQILESRQMIRRQLAALSEREPSPVLPVLIPTIPTFRMTRRLQAGFELEASHAGELFSDTIGVSGDWREAGPVYAIPLRALAAPGIANLLSAGRCISAASAWDVTRAIPTCVVTGQGAGVAAALLAKEGGSASKIDPKHLQACLRAQGVWIPAESLEEVRS